MRNIQLLGSRLVVFLLMKIRTIVKKKYVCLFVGENNWEDIEEEGLGNNGGIISSAPTAILSAPPSTIQPSFWRVS